VKTIYSALCYSSCSPNWITQATSTSKDTRCHQKKTFTQFVWGKFSKFRCGLSFPASLVSLHSITRYLFLLGEKKETYQRRLSGFHHNCYEVHAISARRKQQQCQSKSMFTSLFMLVCYRVVHFYTEGHS